MNCVGDLHKVYLPDDTFNQHCFFTSTYDVFVSYRLEVRVGQLDHQELTWS